MASLSLKNVNEDIIDKLIKNYQNNIVKIKNPYVKVFIKTNNNETITIYKTNTVLIQANSLKSIINENAFLKEFDTSSVKKHQDTKKFNNFNIIGCDEVGVGDFFGPLVVCSAYVSNNFKHDFKNLYQLIKDSKSLKSHQIIDIFKQIKDKIIYDVYIMNNDEYNNYYKNYKNTHILKALAHNKCLKSLIEKNNLNYDFILMDQFVNKDLYYKYLKDIDKNPVVNIEFETKAENKSFAVACASIIARYYFLKTIKDLENYYQVSLPLGASNSVKQKVIDYKKHKPEYVKYFTKLHFNEKIK
ncbi:ribonuclease HIII [Spiroplasma gladiatoris]|uniref:Ribonuclease n=1 Tax=Spiroplasma gladiatoris TaxID=2143 RepID=A0A4P7AHL6_9MOLU|nr:ribonuclease HIII [Spiroplasma gladiatoris]QBQ07924.1 ribonuclease HIII [Spiroplasma gladiatoris]